MEERPEQVIEETSVEEAVAEPTNFSDLLKDGLSDASSEQPEERPSTEEPEAEAKEPEEAEEPKEETLFGELRIGEDDKVGFKTQEEFDAFIKQNPMLNDNFVPKSEYTRATQERAKLEKTLTEQEGKEDKFWSEGLPVGFEAPNQESKQVLKTLFTAYQAGNPEFRQNLMTLVEQANGVLGGQHSSQSAYSPVVDKLQGEVSQLKQQLEQFNQSQAAQAWNSWKASTEKAGIKITDSVQKVMAQAMKFDHEDGRPFTFDDALEYATFKLKLNANDATKKVFAGTRTAKAKSPSPVKSGVSTHMRPEPKTFLDILKQGAEDLT